MDGTFDANGVSEVFGILQGNGILDNTGASNAVFSIYEGNSDTANGGIGNGGEIYTWPGLIRNTGAGKLGITKISPNTAVFTSANTYGGDTPGVSEGTKDMLAKGWCGAGAPRRRTAERAPTGVRSDRTPQPARSRLGLLSSA